MLIRFSRQLQEMSDFSGTDRPLDKRPVLVELGNLAQPLRTRL